VEAARAAPVRALPQGNGEAMKDLCNTFIVLAFCGAVGCTADNLADEKLPDDHPS
jgi:hypothetical protein